MSRSDKPYTCETCGGDQFINWECVNCNPALRQWKDELSKAKETVFSRPVTGVARVVDYDPPDQKILPDGYPLRHLGHFPYMQPRGSQSFYMGPEDSSFMKIAAPATMHEVTISCPDGQSLIINMDTGEISGTLTQEKAAKVFIDSMSTYLRSKEFIINLVQNFFKEFPEERLDLLMSINGSLEEAHAAERSK